MLTPVLAHTSGAPTPDDLWRSWHLDPLVLVLLAAASLLYARGWTPRRGRSRTSLFVAGVLVVALAVVSPLEPLSSALASAHMVQHLLLVVVAAPLLAFSGAGRTLLRGTPAAGRRVLLRLRRRAGLDARHVRLLRHPVAVWALHAGGLWLWHAAVLYEAALRIPLVHAAEHATFLGTGVLLWGVVARMRARTATSGAGVLLLFATTMSSVLLSALLTFAEQPWYPTYEATTRVWGLEPLADQQLAGVLMWVPAGAVYLVAALLLLGGWIRGTETGPAPLQPADPV